MWAKTENWYIYVWAIFDALTTASAKQMLIHISPTKDFYLDISWSINKVVTYIDTLAITILWTQENLDLICRLCIFRNSFVSNRTVWDCNCLQNMWSSKKYFILSKCLLFRSIPSKPDTRICIMRSQARVVNLFCLIIKLVSRPFEAMQAAEGLA